MTDVQNKAERKKIEFKRAYSLYSLFILPIYLKFQQPIKI